jgi:uncharacterized protein YecE (DUF72 family)
MSGLDGSTNCILRYVASIRVGTAGWNVPTTQANTPAIKRTQLERYAAALNCVEVNSSFYRSHKRTTWQRWAASTPAGFQFAVKAPKKVTHMAKMVNCGEELAEFFEEVAGLGEKLGPVLLQTAPSLATTPVLVSKFLSTLRQLHPGLVALEPRHESWFTPEIDHLLCEFNIARVAADPPTGSPWASSPGGSTQLRYYRLHGSPRIYRSPYDASQLENLAARLRTHEPGKTWVVFDNTAAGAGLSNAMELMKLFI